MIVSQVIRVYLAVDLGQIIFRNKDPDDNWIFLIVFLSRIMYFLAIFRAGLVQSELGSLEIVIKSYMKNCPQREEDELFFEITKRDLMYSLQAAILPAGLAILALPKHDRQEMLRIYVLMNFIQESLDVVFFMPAYIAFFIIYAVDTSFGINYLIPNGSLYISLFEIIRVVVINLVLLMKKRTLEGN